MKNIVFKFNEKIKFLKCKTQTQTRIKFSLKKVQILCFYLSSTIKNSKKHLKSLKNRFKNKTTSMLQASNIPRLTLCGLAINVLSLILF